MSIKITKSQLRQIIKEEVSNIKKETKLLKESGFLHQTENLLKRYSVRQDQEMVDMLKQAANDILDAYHSGGVEAVNAIDKTQYDPAIHQMFNWLRSHLRGDVNPSWKKNKEPVKLPQDVEAIANKAQAEAEVSLKARAESEERARAARERANQAEEARRAGLSPEERKREDIERESDAMYGISPSLRRAAKEAYRKMSAGEPLTFADKNALDDLRHRERSGLGS